MDPLVRGHHVVHATYACETHVAAGDQVTFVAWRPHPALAPLCELPIEMVYAGSGADLNQHTISGQLGMRRTIRRAVAEARRRDADVVQLLFLDWFVLGLVLALVAPPLRRGRERLYAVMYWIYFERPAGERRSIVARAKYLVERTLLRWVLTRGTLSGLFVFSDAIRARLIGRGLPAEAIAVIPDPVVVPDIVPEAEAARQKLDLPLRAPLFLFFGETRLDKGPDILLSALAHVRSPCTVVFVGPSVSLHESDFAAARSAIPAHVEVVLRLERVPDNAVPWYFAAADCVVLPYRRLYLGTSGAMQHAGAFARPIIMSDVGILGDMTRVNDLGIVVEPESPQALAAAMDDFIAAAPEWRAEKSRSARRYGEHNDRRVYGGRMRERFVRDTVAAP